MDLHLTTENWQQHANCRDVTPETMQPEVATTRDVQAAKLVCGRGTREECPVLAQCKALAESHVGTYGIHAGEWYGHAPAPVLFCQWCTAPLAGQRSTNRFCNDTCRKRASRAAERSVA